MDRSSQREVHVRNKLATLLAVSAFVLVGLGIGTADAGRSSNPRPASSGAASSIPSTGFGAPLPDLTPDQLALFAAGREEFQSVETVADGLGPAFNNNACAACHSTPIVGGASAITETRFGRLTNGKFDPLAQLGGSLLQQQAIDPHALEKIPPEANVVALRITTPLFGAGLIEAIPDDEIRLNALRRQTDGIAGRVSLIVDVVSGRQRVGRFGWKAQHSSLLGFAGDAYLNEMGITNRFFPVENAPNGNAALLAKYDTVPELEDVVDPASGRSDIDASTDFMRLLAPPQPQRQSASAVAGRFVFARANCAACHLPVMFTGPSPIAALAFKPVALYSDLLLHDMGRLGDGIEQAAAQQREMRTAPLWGLHVRGPFLHDGRAATVADAIRAHDGEGAAARDRYDRLSPVEKQQLLDFLNSI
jgi:CxxC motif-containing protein (DUF1111 family)